MAPDVPFVDLGRQHQPIAHELRAAFDSKWHYSDRPAIKRHREELREEMARCDALVIAGGHVASRLGDNRQLQPA